MSKVYVSQETQVDYGPAVKFGDLVFITAPNDRLSVHSQSLANDDLLVMIRSRLAGFTAEDFLLCSGAPAHMAIAGAVLGSRLKKMLVWDNRTNDYFELRIVE